MRRYGINEESVSYLTATFKVNTEVLVIRETEHKMLRILSAHPNKLMLRTSHQSFAGAFYPLEVKSWLDLEAIVDRWANDDDVPYKIWPSFPENLKI